MSDRLRERVETAVRDLGYVPKRSSSKEIRTTIAVLTPDLQNPYFNEIFEGIEERARAHRLIPVVLNLKRGALGVEHINEWIESIQVRGCIILGGALPDATLITFFQKADYPVVAVNQSVNFPGLKTINIDYAKATCQLTQQLLRLGHRRLAFLGASLASAASREKIRGIESAMREADLTLSVENVLPGAPTVEWGFQAMTALLAQGQRPTAAICSCDLIALGALHAVRSAGLSVPRDISVVGFDDIVMACHANPPLTTISPPKYEMGAKAVELLVGESSAGDSITNYVMLESPLIVRESVAAPPVEG